MIQLGRVNVTVASILGAALIISAIVVSTTIVKVKGYGQTITVTGAAYKPIRSDFAVWNGYISATATDLESAYAKMKADLATVVAFLKQQGFDDDGFTVGTLSIKKNYSRERALTGYTLSQRVTVELEDVDRIARLANDASALIEKGIEFESKSPSYLFTKLDEMKLEMIQKATENAKLRAEKLAESAGSKVGVPRSANVGVFQIRPRHSQEVSNYGINDVSSIEKEIASTVHVRFSIE